MKKKIGRIFVFLIFITTVFSVSGNAINKEPSPMIFNGTLSGYVNDTSMNPIDGALVRVHFHGTYEENYTNSLGYYHVTNIPMCNCLKNCTASKPGYSTKWVLLAIVENTLYDFQLSTGNVLYVGGSGLGNYTSIQEAIDDSLSGDTIFVFDDSAPYYENIEINKPINLIGEDKNTTIIDGKSKDIVVFIHANGVVISGFTIRNSNDACMFIRRASNTFIRNNIIFQGNITGKSKGIEVTFNSSFNNISGNEIYGFYDGIVISLSNNNMIYRNNIHHNFYGVSIFSDSNKIICNQVNFNKHRGVSIAQGRTNLIAENTVTNNGFEEYTLGGIWLGSNMIKDGNNYIKNNQISHNNGTGIYISPTFMGSLMRYVITNNNISNNKLYGIYSDMGYRTFITRNNLIDNPTNAYFGSWYMVRKNAIWFNNYWSDYSGENFYKIHGKFYILFIFSLPWFCVDWHPAQKPYDIP